MLVLLLVGALHVVAVLMSTSSAASRLMFPEPLVIESLITRSLPVVPPLRGEDALLLYTDGATEAPAEESTTGPPDATTETRR